jgi:tetratricopeptide (TPR) repeat protein
MPNRKDSDRKSPPPSARGGSGHPEGRATAASQLDRGAAPARERAPAAAARVRRDETSAPLLALAIGRAGIGLELAEPVEIGCVRVVELSTALPGVRFPLDVSGGVTRFRHRRGELQAIGVEVVARDLERWLAPRLRGLVGTRTPEVWIEVGRARATVCVTASADAGDAARIAASEQDTPVVAFDVHALVPDSTTDDELLFVVANARGAGLPQPPMAIALACVGGALGTEAVRTGAVFALRRPAKHILLAMFPSVGARMPSTDGVRWSALAVDKGTWVARAARDAGGAAPTEDALRAREVAAILAEADDALVRGDLEAARAASMEALERAPRHAEIAARVAGIDARTPERAEAALATLVESGAGQALGLLAGELHAQIGDAGAAVASFERAGHAEPAPALAARAFELAARASQDLEDAVRWLDRALALAPRSVSARWRRVEARLALGRLEDALADVEHLEALARGTRGKYAVWVRAGRAWQSRGVAQHAGPVFERALRYAPDEPAALAGLGVALAGEGRAARGVSLLERALATTQARGLPEGPVRMALARALAERLDDLPTAIAHASAVTPGAAEAALARGLEGRWRTRLGDLTGASLAFARLRDRAASLAPSRLAEQAGAGSGAVHDPAIDEDTRAVVALLIEAAAMERDRRDDLLAAQRHLAVALRLMPQHAESRRAYRDVGALLAGASAEETASVPSGERTEDAPPLPSPPAIPALSMPEEDDDARAARADDLTQRLRADPTNETVADALATLLEHLGRGHELVALLLGRVEDAPADRREEVRSRARAVFERMAAGGGADEPLYRDALEAVSSP